MISSHQTTNMTVGTGEKPDCTMITGKVAQQLMEKQVWKIKGIETVNDLVTGNTFISMTEFKIHFGLTNVDSFKYMQLKRYISQNVDFKSFRHQSNLEGILSESEKEVHMIEKIY